MKNINLLTACTLAVLATSSLTAMAASVDVRVIGTITPAACTPILGGGGAIDYQTIDPATLSATDYTVLPVKSVAISITCEAPAKLAIRALNGRPGTVAGATEGVSGAAKAPAVLFDVDNSAVVGLGLDGDDKIGGYALRLAAGSLLDEVAVDNISRTDMGQWTTVGSPTLYSYSGVERNVTWATAGGAATPLEFTTFSGVLEAQAYLNKRSELDLTKPITLDGMTTIELVYL